MPIAFFDVDGTLLDGPSSEALFLCHLASEGVLGARQAYEGLAFFLRWGRRFVGATAKKNKAYLAGLEVRLVAAIAEGFVHARLERRLRMGVVARIESHRKAGDHVVLLTGTPDFIAEPLARRVGADEWCGTTCACGNGIFLAEPPLRHPFGEDKVRFAAEICRDHGALLAGCAAYADAIADLDLLRSVRRPVAVDPDAPLRRIAFREGWEILADGLLGTEPAPRASGHGPRERTSS